MKKIFLYLISSLAFFAVISQYYLSVIGSQNYFESSIRYFSYFTILSNIIVGFYSLFMLFEKPKKIKNSFSKTGVITAITIYITFVCIVYQFALRPFWNPTGFQRIIDEVLHSIIPILFIIYWLIFEKKSEIKYSLIPKWTIFPLSYLGVVLIRGVLSGFYPYYFLDALELGYFKVLVNIIILILFFIIMSFVYVLILKIINKYFDFNNQKNLIKQIE